MDSVSLIVEALAAGAAAGAQGTATQAVKDAYGGLKGLVTRRFGDRPKELDRPAEELRAELEAVDAGADEELVSAARRLLELLDQGGKYQVDARKAQGVQIGDHGTQINKFG
ncbi:hypothetical protein [Pseudonocardia acaciae]|uniref:hypothetical protein n=1 Tax=Pseudonocardia acaciae TaxID=551276 RepID=UPI00048EA71C|nr:hypothetical protein [Pseudonocardia acaciae]